jgi:hypothetical protein
VPSSPAAGDATVTSWPPQQHTFGTGWRHERVSEEQEAHPEEVPVRVSNFSHSNALGSPLRA